MSIEAVEYARKGTDPDADASAAADAAPPVVRTMAQQAVRDTVSRGGARAGLLWLGILAFFGIFGPFLASSHPFALKVDNTWSSPMLRHLTPADVLLLVAMLITVVAVIARVSFGRWLLLVVTVIAVLAWPVTLIVRPPQNIVYQQYREWTKQGKVQSAVYTIIPFSPRDRLRDQPDARLQPPSKQHWLGTDTNGADVLSNIVHASRIALSIGFIATGIAVVLGVVFGGLMGYYAGTVDILGMRLIEILEAIPRLFLLITVTAFVENRNIYLMMCVIGLTGWTGYARYIRGEFFTLRKRDFVQAAIAAGLPQRLVIFRHMLPNGLTPVLVSTSFGVASAILYESILSFLGLGLIDEASWGGLLNQARAGGSGFIWWLATFPGFAIFLTVFSYNLIGEAIRDAIDPRLRKRD